MILDGGSTDLALIDADFRQKFPLIPDIAYAIDNMCHQDDFIDLGHYIALTIYVPRAPIREIIDAEHIDNEKWPKRQLRAEQLMDIAGQTIRTLPPEIVGGLAYASLHWLDGRLTSFVNWLASWAYQDATTGGAAKSFIRPPRLDDDAHPFKRTARQLRSPDFIKRHVRSEKEPRQFRTHVARIIALTELVPSSLIRDQSPLFHSEMDAQRQRAKVEGAKRMAEFWADAEAGRAVYDEPGRHVELKRKLAKGRKRRVRRERAVIKRGLLAAERFLPRSTISDFVHGRPVLIRGTHMDLMVQSRGNLAARGHGAIDLSAVKITSEADPEKFADLCFYVDDTPAIDQLTAIALNLQSDDETEVIKAANVTLLLPGGRDIPMLADRARDSVLHQRAADPENWTTLISGRFSRRDCRETRQLNESAYIEETRSIWRERVEVEILGRWRKQYQQLATQG